MTEIDKIFNDSYDRCLDVNNMTLLRNYMIFG